ncbi:M20/M25/M40 family metallo-hydrolase [Dactylosporangium sp. AC04546]|uniref:M20/M25/M40 family metallo-hydrolase n=1 Tax=Dactylosporangium sp. AC04546 TaxID=2862460 RepID=UPI001EDDFA0D|nr:M20/M25/M40 family metallo-hydrolase [Dactylosporangium sp. AC04546]WVK79059.1 M20/M25/M40 family metallo-hydrolase [Dactylosporangium sp. AC04546]
MTAQLSQPLGALHRADDIDPVSLAQSMITFDTSHNGEGADTLPYATMLARVWEHHGVATEIIATPKPGNVHFLARVPGAGRPEPLLLLCHSDVVPAAAERWRVPPFSGEIHDGRLWGRGAVDMKGAAAAIMSAVLRHVREGATFDRDLLYLADCDEEGGWFGTRWLVEHHPEKVRAGAVLTEGGWTLSHPGRSRPMLASMTVLDRTFGAVRLTARGAATHSSRPLPDSAIMVLARAVSTLEGFTPEVALTGLTRRYFGTLAKASEDPRLVGALGRLLAADTAGERAAAAAEVVAAGPYPALHNAMLRATVAHVVQDGGLRANVIPAEASTLLQLRFTPQGQSPAEVLAALRAHLAGQPVELRVVGPPGEEPGDTLARWERDWRCAPAPLDGDVFAAWEAAVGEVYPGVPATPALFEASTSGKPWQERGVPVYGVYPYVVDDEELTAMHGDNERVRVEALREGAELMYRLLARFRM